MKVMLAIILVLLFSGSVFTNSVFATEVRYTDYSFQAQVVSFSTVDTFLICENCAVPPLDPYKEKPKPKVIVSVKYTPTEDKKDNTPKEHTVYFDFNKYALIPTEEVELNKFVQSLEEPVVVLGYASPEGSVHYNKVLSAKRAQAVADYLRQKGKVVLRIEGHGPIDGPDWRLCRKVIIKKKGGELSAQ
ncbi:MAG: OmpA family protein [Dictyoglomus turgidum]